MELSEIAEHVEALQRALVEYPSLQPVLAKMLKVTEAPITSAAPVVARRRMTAVQLKANSLRMKKRWRLAKRLGKTNLGN